MPMQPTSQSLFRNAPPEFLLAAACCAGRDGSPAHADRLAERAAGPVHWDRFLATVDRHRIGGLCSLALAAVPDVPPAVRQTLAKRAEQTLFSNMHAVGMLSRLAKDMQAQDLPFAVLKGVPLCMAAFGDLRARQSKDIDILVGAGHAAAAEAILRAQGFQRIGLGAGIDEAELQHWIDVRKHFEYRHPLTGIQMELHWRPFDNATLQDGNAMLRDRVLQTVLPGVQLPVLPPAELLLNLCAHGAGHAWFRLKWLADVETLLSRDPGSLPALLELARGRDLDRPVLQALLLCDNLFGSGYLHSAGLAEEPSRTVRVLARIAADALLAEDITGPTAHADFVPRNQALAHLLLRRSWRYRMHEVRVNLASPADWENLGLPAPLRFLYVLLRVPLWIRRRWLSA